MADLFCGKHPETRLVNVLKGGAGFCVRCNLYAQAAGIPEPVRDIPRPVPTRKRKKPAPVGLLEESP